MKSNFAEINKLSHETVEELNERIESEKYSPDELAEWLKGIGVEINVMTLTLHAKKVRNSTGLSSELHRRKINGTSDMSVKMMHQELGDLNCLKKLIPERIKQLEESLQARAKSVHSPKTKPIPPYAAPKADEKG